MSTKTAMDIEYAAEASPTVCFGSLAVLHRNTSPMSAYSPKAVIQKHRFRLGLNVCFRP